MEIEKPLTATIPIPPELLAKLQMWSHWISRERKKIFLIIDAGDDLTNTAGAMDMVWLMEFTASKQTGKRTVHKVPLLYMLEQIRDGKLEHYLLPIT